MLQIYRRDGGRRSRRPGKAVAVAAGGGFAGVTYHTAAFARSSPNNAAYAKHCYGVHAGEWVVPLTQADVNSSANTSSKPSPPPPLPPSGGGPCTTALGCGLNGVCSAGTCHCRSAWTGDHCQTLALEPASLTAGYHHVNADGTKASSWGGSVLWSNEDERWHMFASELVNSCGLHAWACNSQVIHATARSLEEPFVGAGVVQPRFAHEHVVVRAPSTGEWVMYFTGCDPLAINGSQHSCSPVFDGDGAAANCTGLGDGSTPGNAGMKRIPASFDHTWMSWAKAPAGPWSAPVMVLAAEQIDSNLSPVIAKDNSLLGLWRGGLNKTFASNSMQRIITAKDWRDPTSYTPEMIDLFPAVRSTEDPFVYLDEDGHYHAVFHHACPKSCVCGGHAYSLDGREWHYPYINGSAYFENVTLMSGQTLEFRQRERPHLVFAPDGVTPLALTNGAGVDGNGKFGDATWTFLQPLRQNATVLT